MRKLERNEMKSLIGGGGSKDTLEDDAGSCSNCSKTIGETTVNYSCTKHSGSVGGTTVYWCTCSTQGGSACSYSG